MCTGRKWRPAHDRWSPQTTLIHAMTCVDLVFEFHVLTFQSLRDLEYTVKDKIFFESLLDAEFEQILDNKGNFYNG